MVSLREGSLCTGYNGLGLAIALAIGTQHELVFVADPDPAAARLLAHHYPAVPNLGDIKSVDWQQVPPVDLLTAGYPCQPFSFAGQRKGTEDDRHLWPAIANAIRHLRPGYVFLENVTGHLSLGFGYVLADLAALGYVGSWCCIRASDVGAAHRRDRVFILASQANLAQDRQAATGGKRRVNPVLAATQSAAIQLGRGFALLPTPVASPGTNAQTKRSPSQWAGKHGLNLAAEVCELLPTPRAVPVGQEENAKRWLERNTELATSRARGASGMPLGVALQLLPQSAVSGSHPWGQYAAAIARWQDITGQAAPEPTQPGKNGPGLAPAFVEWLMGLAPGWVTDIRGISRIDQLRLLGNGVVLQQAAAAFAYLFGTSQVNATELESTP